MSRGIFCLFRKVHRLGPGPGGGGYANQEQYIRTVNTVDVYVRFESALPLPADIRSVEATITAHCEPYSDNQSAVEQACWLSNFPNVITPLIIEEDIGIIWFPINP
jgi:hypothetical protein